MAGTNGLLGPGPDFGAVVRGGLAEDVALDVGPLHDERALEVRALEVHLALHLGPGEGDAYAVLPRVNLGAVAGD